MNKYITSGYDGVFYRDDEIEIGMSSADLLLGTIIYQDSNHEVPFSKVKVSGECILKKILPNNTKVKKGELIAIVELK